MNNEAYKFICIEKLPPQQNKNCSMVDCVAFAALACLILY